MTTKEQASDKFDAKEIIKVPEEKKKNDKKRITDLKIKKILEGFEKKYHGTDFVLGKGLLTLPSRISSPRHAMVSSHLDQCLTLVRPEIPRVYTNYENMIGRHSTGYYKSESNYEVLNIIPRFNTSGLKRHLYLMVVYDTVNDRYDVINKMYGEDLTESYAYMYNNEVLDSKDVGDDIMRNEVLYRSTSYDEDMNYRYGLNAKAAYLICDDTIEDAIVCSESFARKAVSKKLEPVKVTLNDNDILINLYGDHNNFKSFPDIGEEVKDQIMCSQRRINYSQSLFDLEHSNLRKVNFSTDTPFYTHGTVVDIKIYCNKPIESIPDNKYNSQILKYLKMENEYHNKVISILGKIIESGKEYSEDLAFYYKYSKDVLNPKVKWKDDKNVFNNMIIEFTLEQDDYVYVGSKLVG